MARVGLSRSTIPLPELASAEVCELPRDREVSMLLRVFQKRLRGYRAIGYARGEAPLGFAEASEEVVVEYDSRVPGGADAFDFS